MIPALVQLIQRFLFTEIPFSHTIVVEATLHEYSYSQSASFPTQTLSLTHRPECAWYVIGMIYPSGQNQEKITMEGFIFNAVSGYVGYFL